MPPDHLKPYQWPKGISGNPRGRPPSLPSQVWRRILEEQDPESGLTKLETLMRKYVDAAVADASSRACEGAMARLVPVVERHEIELVEPDDSGLRDRLSALAPRAGANGVDRHANGAAKEEPA